MDDIAMEGLIDSFNALIQLIQKKIAKLLHGYRLIENWNDSGFDIEKTVYTFDDKYDMVYVFYSRDAVIYWTSFLETAQEILKRGSRPVTTHVKDFSNIVKHWDKFGFIPPEDMDEIRIHKKEIQELADMSTQLVNIHQNIQDLNQDETNVNYSQAFYPINNQISYLQIYLKLMRQSFNRKSRVLLDQHAIEYYRKQMTQSLETLDACTKILTHIFSLAGGNDKFLEYRHTAKGILVLIQEYVEYIESIIKGLDAMGSMMNEPIHFMIKTYYK